MTVTVTKKPGGITQLFNTETGRITYKCKSNSAYMISDAFGGIVKFNQKGAMAIVTGHLVSLESCDIIKEGDADYNKALSEIIRTHKEFVQNNADLHQKEIQELESMLSKS